MRQCHRNMPPGHDKRVITGLGTKSSHREMFSIICALILFGDLPQSWALESDQCVDMGGALTTLSFKTEIHEIPADFWSEGVDKSKGILETILDKIKIYEKHSDSKWIDILRENFALGKGNQFIQINEGEIWTDDKTGMSIKMQKGAFCAVVDSFKSSASQLTYTCEESEQLYGIGYHKVYENCKNDPFLSKFSIDWGVCLHAHYPWVDMMKTNICVMKSYKNDFLACFCSKENGVLHKRGFCITKFECLLNGQGVEQTRVQELEVRQDCIHHIQYFLEANTNDDTWFRNALKKDNLRVRAPYHPDSSCRNMDFFSKFDIGQLDVDNVEAGIEVYTPFVAINIDTEVRQDEENFEDENMSCMPDIDPAHKVRMDILSFFFEERIISNLVIWIPGILFIYSSIFEESGAVMRFIVGVIQLLISSIGIYNMAISFLPDQYFSSIPDVRSIQISVFGSVILLTQVLFNFKEVTEHFLKVSILNFIPDIVFWKMIMVMYTEHRMANFKIIIGFYFVIVMIYSLYKLRIMMQNIYAKKDIDNSLIEDGFKRSKKKKDKPKNQRCPLEESNPSKPSNEKKRIKGKKLTEEVFAIVCQWKCTNVLNIGYISINCSEKCYNQFHKQCWEFYSSFNCLQNEQNLLGKNCLTDTCFGKIYEIVWVDKFGIETPKKFLLSEMETNRFGNKKKIKNKKTIKLIRSLSETSGSSIEERMSSTQIQYNQETPPKMNLQIPNLNKTDNSLETSNIRTYASTVRNNNTQPQYSMEPNTSLPFQPPHICNPVDSFHNSEIVDELLGENCPESFDPRCKLPQKSKILTLIRENSQPDYSFERTVGEIGDQLEPENSANLNEKSSSTSGFLFDNEIIAPNNSSNSLTFVSGLKEIQTISSQIERHSPERNETKLKPEKEVFHKKCESPTKPIKLDTEIIPLARILFKQVSGFSLQEVNSAVKDILNDVKMEDITIPVFRNILIQKLENTNPWEDGVYMSDDDYEGSNDSDIEECLICTELLEQDVQHLDPCGHVFHEVCIKEWVRKEASCPKCRAEVQL